MAFRLVGVALLVALTAATGCAGLPAAAILVAQGPRRSAPPSAPVPATTPGAAASAPIELAPTDAARLDGEPKLVDLTFATHRFLLLGAPPTLIRENCVRGSELHVLLVSRAARRIIYEQFQGAATGELTADYSQAPGGVYEFTEWTDDPRARAGEPGVPFVATRVVVAPDGRCYPKRRLLLEAEPGDAGEIQRWHDRAIASPRADSADLDAFEEAMLHLRNLAVNHPEEALAALEDLKAHLGDRVHLSEMWNDRKGEIEVIRALRPDPARTAGRTMRRPALTPPRATRAARSRAPSARPRRQPHQPWRA